MRIGELKHRISFYQRTVAETPSNNDLPGNGLEPYDNQNSYGEELEWTLLSTRWASAEPLLGNEYFAAERINTKCEIKFRVRFFAELNEKLRIQFNSVTYEILDAINIKMIDRDCIIYAKRVET